jgi:hypothetical protein
MLLYDHNDFLYIQETGMVTFPNQNSREATVTISLKADGFDYDSLRDGSRKAGLGQSNMLHLLLEMMRLRVISEQSRGNLAVDKFGSMLEAFVWLVAQDSGLLTSDELQSGAWAAENVSGGTTFKERQEGLFALLQKRFAERYGSVNGLELSETEPFEQVDDLHPAQIAAEVEAKRKEAQQEARRLAKEAAEKASKQDDRNA